MLKNNNIAISEEGQKARGDARLSLDFKFNLETKKIAIVWDSWKYIYTDGNCEELYDLSTDKGEKNNLLIGDVKLSQEVINKARDLLKNHIDFVIKFKDF